MNNRIIFLLLILLILYSCKKDNDYALIQTGIVTNIDSTGATFHARVLELGNTNIVEHGFVWSKNNIPEIHDSDKKIISGAPSVGIISERIPTTLVVGITYHVRAFIRNSNYITYGKIVTFKSLGSSAPEINDFHPKSGSINDTLKIYGKHFSFIIENNEVFIGDNQARILYVTEDTILAKVPSNLDIRFADITVSTSGRKAKAPEKFELIAPQLYDFEAKIGSYGSEITITGNNFIVNQESLKVFFDKYQSTIIKTENQSLTVCVPDSLDKSKCVISVSMNNIIVNATDSFELEPILINDFSPKIILTGQKLRLTGNNFSPIATNNTVIIGGVNAELTNVSANELELMLPLQDICIYSNRNSTISVKVAGVKKIYNENLLINDKWFRLANTPISNNSVTNTPHYHRANVFMNKNKAYIGLHNRSDFWEYDPSLDKWKKLMDFPGDPRFLGSGFVIDDKIFYGIGEIGLNDWWEYNIDADTWIEKSNFAGPDRRGAIAFQIDNYGYLFSGHNPFGAQFTDFWRYSYTDDSWILIEDVKMNMNYGIALVYGGKAYIGFGQSFIGDMTNFIHVYSPSSNTWDTIPILSELAGVWCKIGFLLEEKIIVRTAYTSKLYSYNILSNSWTKLQTDILYDFTDGIGFSVGSKAYFGLGLENQMWEYDPNRQ